MNTPAIAPGPAGSFATRREERIVRTWVMVSLTLIIGSGVFLGYWGRLQRIGVPGVMVVRQDVHLMPDRVSPDLAFDSLKVVATNAVPLPLRIAGYKSSELPIQRVVYETLPKDTTFGQRLYRAADGFQIQNTVVLMGTDRTSIHKPEFCLVGSGFQILKAEEVRIPMNRPFPYELPAMKMTLRRELVVDGKPVVREGVYLFWFVSGDKLTSRHWERMWWMAKDLITRGELQRWAYVIAFSVCQPGQTEPTYRRMVRFLEAAVPEFQLVPRSGAAGVAGPLQTEVPQVVAGGHGRP